MGFIDRKKGIRELETDRQTDRQTQGERERDRERDRDRQKVGLSISVRHCLIFIFDFEQSWFLSF